MPIKTLSEKKRIWTELWIQLVFFMSIWSWICKKNWKILLSNWNQLNKSPKVDAFQFPEDFLLIQFVSSDYILSLWVGVAFAPPWDENFDLRKKAENINPVLDKYMGA